MSDVGGIQIITEPQGRVLVRADEKGLDTLSLLARSAKATGWANIADEVTGAEKVRFERVARSEIPSE